jgi:hypothetical protein
MIPTAFRRASLAVILLVGAAAARAAAAPEFRAETVRGREGFFRVGQTTAGQWWLIDPAGKPFFSKGVTAVNRAGTQGGRRAKPGPYQRAIDAKFGAGDPEPFVADVLRRVREWNLNTLASWTTAEFFDRGVPYTEIVEFRYSAPAMIREHGVDLPDVFDPRWPAACDAKAAEICRPRRESRDLIGYFSDNEFGWGQPRAEGLWNQVVIAEETARAERPSLLQVCLSLDPGFAAHAAAWEFVLAPHGGDLAKLGAAWGVALPDRAAVRRITADDKRALLTPGYLKDSYRFSREFARRYFATTAEAIRRHDPNHLILGARFGGPPGEAVLRECVAPHVDVLSANNYRHTFAERLDEYYRVNGMPILVGEFAWASDYFTRLEIPGEPVGLSTLERMLGRGRRALEEAILHPGVVGFAWYRWVQGDPAKIPPFSYGLVYINDQTANEHVQLLAAICARAEVLRLEAGGR